MTEPGTIRNVTHAVNPDATVRASRDGVCPYCHMGDVTYGVDLFQCLRCGRQFFLGSGEEYNYVDPNDLVPPPYTPPAEPAEDYRVGASSGSAPYHVVGDGGVPQYGISQPADEPSRGDDKLPQEPPVPEELPPLVDEHPEPVSPHTDPVEYAEPAETTEPAPAAEYSDVVLTVPSESVAVTPNPDPNLGLNYG